MEIRERIKGWAPFLVYTAIAIAVLVLLGWQFDIGILKRPLPHLVAMNPATAVCFITSGAAFLFFGDARLDHKPWGYFFAILTCVISLLKIIALAGGLDLHVDTILYHNQLQYEVVGKLSNSMAPNTAINFLFTALSILLLYSHNRVFKLIGISFASLVFVVALLSIIGYTYQVKEFYSVLAYIPMAIHTAIGFCLISLALLFNNPETGYMSVLTSKFAGGVIARILIPSTIIILIVLGYIRIYSNRHFPISVEFGVALLITSIVVVFLILIWIVADKTNKEDALRIAAEEKLKQQTIELASVNKELESFSYSVSHDLRAPLRAVSGFANMLQEDYADQLDEEGQRLIGIIIRSGQRMGGLIDDLLNFSRLGRKELVKTNVNMNELARLTTEEVYRITGSSTPVNIDNIAPVMADRALMSHVFTNLISNAIKYSSKSENPTVNIGSMIRGKEVIYSISDNGVGFDMKYVNKLFGVFQRLHTSEEFEGTGVGLAIVQRIIVKHGGNIWVDAMPNKGATFYFSLPIL